MAKSDDPRYPFVPKTTRHMKQGQFWAVPLSDGRFACGYVVSVDSSRRVRFQAGLTDWVGTAKPTLPDLRGRRVIEQGYAHLKTITDQGGEILGCCEVPLPVMPDLRDHTWGYNVIRLLAEKHLVKAG